VPGLPKPNGTVCITGSESIACILCSKRCVTPRALQQLLVGLHTLLLASLAGCVPET
jgi:hypothetical protein